MSEHYQELVAAVRRVQRMWIGVARNRAIARATALGAALGLVLAAAAMLLPVTRAGWAVGSAIVAAVVLAALVLPLIETRRRPVGVVVARLIEERYPELEDRLVSAIELGARPNTTSSLLASLVSDAAARVRKLDLDAVIEPAARRRGRITALGGMVALALAAVFDVSVGVRLAGGGSGGLGLIARRAAAAPARPLRIARIDLSYHYPRFTGLPVRVERDSGDIYAPAGTAVQVRVTTNRPAAGGELTVNDQPPVALAPGSMGTLTGGIVVTRDGSYRIAPRDQNGRLYPAETEYFIRVMEDRPPEVRITEPGGDKQVTKLDEVPVEAKASDDYGLASFELAYSVRGEKERAIPLVQGLSAPAAPRSVTGRHTFYLEDMGVEPGDFVTYYARARDVSRGKRQMLAKSDIYFLEVKPFEGEFAAAQSQAMGGSGNRSLDDLAAAQKQIVIATWKLDRRPGGRANASDIGTVARAQGDVRRRAEQMASSLALAGEASSKPATAFSRAVEAMTKAQESLEALNTSAAIPREMEALNQLLKAQADQRKKLVTRQSASGNNWNGSNRADADLSDLFDRELAKQQQTKYEAPAGSRRDDRSQEDEALQRVRELAERQGDLNSRQEELARRRGRLSEDELRRQLERLTKEQTELRRQAEELSRQLGRDREQGQDSRLRDASNEMQGAASELRRQDPQQARERGSRALEHLRDLERQLQAAAGGAATNLELGARRLADEQRRIAERAQRPEAGQPGAAAEALAHAQEKLAREAGELRRELEAAAREPQAAPANRPRTAAADQQGAGDPQATKKALGEASRQAERDQLERRARAAANTMRRAGGGAAVEETRSLAQRLDALADRLGQAARGGQDDGSEKIAADLARARDLRDRLAALERRMAEARDKQAAAAARQRSASAGGEKQQTGPASDARDRMAAPTPSVASAEEPQDLRRLRDEYARQLRQAQQLLDQLRRQDPTLGRRIDQFIGTNYTYSAPGTEAFKQDLSRWSVLQQDVREAMERLETRLSDRLREKDAKNRLAFERDEQPPPPYRRLVDKYYEALSKKNPKP